MLRKMSEVQPYGDADLLCEGAVGGQVAVAEADVVGAHRSGRQTPFAHVGCEAAEGLHHDQET